MELIPHERSLVQRMEGKPFVLLGVDPGDSKARLKRIEAQKQISWRSWCDEGGAAADRWQVQMFPTFYLIDHQGVIRAGWVSPPPAAVLERTIDQLVAEVKDKTS